jgi:hypothetical protein
MSVVLRSRYAWGCMIWKDPCLYANKPDPIYVSSLDIALAFDGERLSQTHNIDALVQN